MAEAGANVWATAVAGIFTLAGVGLGVWLTYSTTQKINKQQSREARKVRKITQLQKLDACLEGMSSQISAVVAQVTGIVGFNHPPKFSAIPEAALSDIQFLIRVYLPEADVLFKEMKLDYGQCISKAFESIAEKARGDMVVARDLLVAAIDVQASFVAKLQKAQAQIAFRVQEIESE